MHDWMWEQRSGLGCDPEPGPWGLLAWPEGQNKEFAVQSGSVQRFGAGITQLGALGHVKLRCDCASSGVGQAAALCSCAGCGTCKPQPQRTTKLLRRGACSVGG